MLKQCYCLETSVEKIQYLDEIKKKEKNYEINSVQLLNTNQYRVRPLKTVL